MNEKVRLVLATILLVLTAVPASADRLKNIVLVHGAWVDGSGWKPVYEILSKEGFNVTVVQVPETSFEDDVAAAKRILDLQDGPAILVGHSYGGSIITEAGVHPNVAGLVYVAAHAPDVGEDESALGKKTPSVLAKTEGAIKKTPDDFTYLDPAVFLGVRRHRRYIVPTAVGAPLPLHNLGRASLRALQGGTAGKISRCNPDGRLACIHDI